MTSNTVDSMTDRCSWTFRREEEGMPTDYIITIYGHLDQEWSAWFDGLTITNGVNGEGTLTGPIPDQAALHGLLVKIRDLGLHLIAVVPRSMATHDGTGNSGTLDGSRAANASSND